MAVVGGDDHHGIGSKALAQFAEPAIESSIALGDAILAFVAVRGAHAEVLLRFEPLPEQVLHGVGFVGVEREETGKRPGLQQQPADRRLPVEVGAVERAAQVAEELRRLDEEPDIGGTLPPVRAGRVERSIRWLRSRPRSLSGVTGVDTGKEYR